MGDKAAAVTGILAAAGSIIELIKTILEVWSSLPFGPEDDYPDSYYRLRETYGSDGLGDEGRDEYSAFNKSADCVNWDLAYAIAKQSGQQVHSKNHPVSEEPNNVYPANQEMYGQVYDLLSSMNEEVLSQVQDRLYVQRPKADAENELRMLELAQMQEDAPDMPFLTPPPPPQFPKGDE